MALNKVEICGVNTSKLPVLKAEEKEELFKRIKEGDEQARELYIRGNLRLVLSVIRRFQNSNENADDLFQIGCIGLIKAIDNFDTTLQVKFSTYAVPMIIGEIRRYLRDNNSIRVSRSRVILHIRRSIQRKLHETALKRTYDHGNRRRNRYRKRNDRLCHGCDSRIRSASLSRFIQKAETLYMSWTRSAIKRIKKNAGLRILPCGKPCADSPPGKNILSSCVFMKENPDGSRSGNWYLPGTGQPSRKKRAEIYAQLSAPIIFSYHLSL